MPETSEPRANSRLAAVVVDTARSPYARLRPVGIDAVTLADAFWEPRCVRNRDVTLPSQFRHLEDTGCLDNFRRAAGKDAAFQGFPFSDSDLYKWLEAAASSLVGPHDPALEAMVDTAIETIAASQRADGYLNSYFACERADQRWTTITTGRNGMHELYCAGHLFQAAVAHYRATGKRTLIDVAARCADHIADTFGPGDEQRHGFDGHPEIEMALVELYRATGNHRYLQTAQYLLEVRRGMDRMNDCAQSLQPFRELKEIDAHAVCAVYLTSGATDIATETGDAEIVAALDRLWESMTAKKMYVTGGIGARYQYEAFGSDYELPAHAYAETCAAIGSIMWNWRMLLMTGEARCADLIEQTLYNGFLSGLSLDGEHYFYTNPLTDDGTHRRQAWFGCACCPPNIARLLAQLPGYFYSTTDGGDIYIHQYAAQSARIVLPKGETLALTQTATYPWDGAITITIDEAPTGARSLHLRIPAWADGATVTVNGEPAQPAPAGGYHAIEREWQAGDRIALSLPMPIRRIAGHPAVEATQNRLAVARGPLVYCIEQADNGNVDVRSVQVWASDRGEVSIEPDLLGGIAALHLRALTRAQGDWSGPLYAPVNWEALRLRPAVTITAIPYYAWANREPGPMRVWLPIV